MPRPPSSFPPTRRSAIATLLAAAATLAADPALAALPTDWPGEAKLGPPRPFSFDRLRAIVRAMAKKRYQPPLAPPPALTHAVDYDAFGHAVYRPDATLWDGQPGDEAVRFFPMGFAAPIPVAVSVVSGRQARAVTYADDLFDMPADSPLRRLGPNAGFGGFRVMNADRRTDWIAYLGASYFRSADPFNQYGLSARGIALDTAASRPEEFPAFTAFWLQPDPAGLIVYALLDGPSVAGAFRIAHQRSPAGLVQEIQTELRFRAPVERLGLAPLTSMYWYGQTDRTPADDWRPQVHDSDGLSIWTGAGERIWRPLANPPRVAVNTFLDHGPRGFGLMQRDRNFADYQDDGVFYDRRPSAWVEPIGDWGAGSVQLVEIPTRSEVDDNIVAFWSPAAPVTAGQTLSLGYRLHWAAEEPGPIGVARVIATRSGRGGRPATPDPLDRRKLVIDFAGDSLAGLTRQSGVEPVVTLSAGAAIDAVAYPVEGQPAWRLMFDVAAPRVGSLDLRAFLRRRGDALTETWIHQIMAA
jgi:glucans biosynthesis protein